MRVHDQMLETELAFDGRPSSGCAAGQTVVGSLRTQVIDQDQSVVVVDDALGSADADPPSRRTHQVASAGGLVALLAGTAILALANGSIFALLGEVQTQYGLNVASLGAIASVAFFTSLIGQLGLSPLADRGYAPQLLSAAMVLSTIGLLWFGAANTFAELVASRALLGLGIGMWVPAAQACAIRLAPHDAARQLGRLLGIDAAALTTAPVIAVLIATRWGLSVPFIALGAVALATTPFVLVSVGRALARRQQNDDDLLAVREQTHQALEDDTISWRDVKDVVRGPAVIAVLVLAVANGLPYGAYDATWARYLTDNGASPTFIGISLGLYAIPFVVFTNRGARIAERLGTQRVALWCTFGLGLCAVSYAVFSSPMAVVGVSFVDAVIDAIAVPAAIFMMTQLVPEKLLATGHGILSAAMTLSAAVAALVMPTLYDVAGPVVMLLTLATLIVASTGAAKLLFGRARVGASVTTAIDLAEPTDTVSGPDKVQLKLAQ